MTTNQGSHGHKMTSRSNKATFTDLEMKEKGNKAYCSRKYDEAAQWYTSAISRNPSIPIYYTNRALTNLRMNRHDDVIADCRAALEMDANNVKAHFFIGQSLCELDLLDDGVKHLQRSYDLAKEQRLTFGDEMCTVLRHWRKRRFSMIEEKRLSEEIELQTYLSRLIREDRERNIDEIKDTFAKEGKPNSLEESEKIVEMEKFSDTCMAGLNNLFAKVDERRRKREVPDYLCGKISFEILRDPVVTPSGITYERKDIEEHLMRIGHFDPLTRAPLTADQLIPNYGMKEVVDNFVAENEWALDY